MGIGGMGGETEWDRGEPRRPRQRVKVVPLTEAEPVQLAKKAVPLAPPEEVAVAEDFDEIDAAAQAAVFVAAAADGTPFCDL